MKQLKNKNKNPKNNQVFRRTALATAIAVAVAPMEVALAGSFRDQPWGRNLEFSLVPTTEIEDLLLDSYCNPCLEITKN